MIANNLNMSSRAKKVTTSLSDVRSAASYWKPSRVVVSAWLAHAPFSSWLVNELRPSVFVELGTHNGFSFFTFCEASSRAEINMTSFAIDTWEGDDQAGFYGDDIFIEVDDYRQRHFDNSAVLLRGHFSDFVNTFTDGQIDLLHIDGRHGYEDVKNDFQAWLPKMSDRGVVIFHDVNEHADGFGVWQLWDEISTRYPSFDFKHGHGLGVLAVGRHVPDSLRPLFAADNATQEQIRNFYSTLGDSVELEYAKEVEMARLARDVDMLNSVASERQEHIYSLEAALTSLMNSHSWRVTAPLRLFSSFLSSKVRKGFIFPFSRLRAFRR